MNLQKKEARRLVRQRSRELLGKSRVRALSGEWLKDLEQRADFSSARVVLVFSSLPDEVPTQMLLTHWYQQKTLLLPTVIGDDLHLHPYQGEDKLQMGAFGILEAQTPSWQELENIDLAIIPGLAFDAQGYRLGRGRGFYDRLLAHPHFSTIPLLGLAYRFQQLDAVPHEQHDQRVDEVIWV